MLCLFRNSKIHPRLDRYAILASWLSVFAWLYFAFIEKSLMGKLIEGKALIVDLVFGLPLVLALAVVVYAMVYWLLKIIVIFLLPQAIVHIDPNEQNTELHEQEIANLEAEHGKEYWNESQQNQVNETLTDDSEKSVQSTNESNSSQKQ